MTISGLNSPGAIAYTSASTTRPASQPAGDQVSMSLSPDTFSNLVTTAGQMPEVRSEVVDAYKARIQSGEYPSSQTLDGLADVIGDHWSQLTQAVGADTSSS